VGVMTNAGRSVEKPWPANDRPARRKKIRVLHAVGGMNRGGTELLLLSVLRNLDRREIECDILVREEVPGILDDEVRRLGLRILKCTHGEARSPM
jgi:hypothetical protein